jgi:hypothetical protein
MAHSRGAALLPFPVPPLRFPDGIDDDLADLLFVGDVVLDELTIPLDMGNDGVPRAARRRSRGRGAEFDKPRSADNVVFHR